MDKIRHGAHGAAQSMAGSIAVLRGTEMTETTIETPAAHGWSLAAGIGMLVAIFALSAIWVAFGGAVLHLRSFFASFVFAWYWGVMDKVAFDRLPAALLGALVGVVLAWQLSWLSAHYGTHGLVAGVAIIALAVFIQLMNWVPMAVNLCGMLFLAILTAPQFAGTDFLDVGATILAGGLYMAAVVYVARRVMAARGMAV